MASFLGDSCYGCGHVWRGAETPQRGRAVVMRSRCVGAWSIPGATEVLSVIIMARKQAVKTHCTPHPLTLCLLQDLELTLPNQLQENKSQPGGAFCCSHAGDTVVRGAVQKGEEHRETKSQQESLV